MADSSPAFKPHEIQEQLEDKAKDPFEPAPGKIAIPESDASKGFSLYLAAIEGYILYPSVVGLRCINEGSRVPDLKGFPHEQAGRQLDGCH